jgi:hypothetical protein
LTANGEVLHHAPGLLQSANQGHLCKPESIANQAGGLHTVVESTEHESAGLRPPPNPLFGCFPQVVFVVWTEEQTKFLAAALLCEAFYMHSFVSMVVFAPPNCVKH